MMDFGREKRPPPNFDDSLQQEPDLAPIAESLYETDAVFRQLADARACARQAFIEAETREHRMS